MTYRNPDLLALARLAPHCMGCRSPNYGDVVAAHSNQGRDGKGMALKASDARVSFLCHVCHALVDVSPSMTQEERVALWERTHRDTVGWLIESGHLVVRPADYVEPIHAPKAKARVKKSRALPSGRKMQNAARPIQKHTAPWGRREETRK